MEDGIVLNSFSESHIHIVGFSCVGETVQEGTTFPSLLHPCLLLLSATAQAK